MKNGRSKQVEAIVETVMEELQKRSESGRGAAGDAADSASKMAGEAVKSAGKAYKSASGAVKDADISDKVEKILEFIEENTSVVAQVGKKLAGDAVKEAPAAAAAVGEAVSNAAEAGAEAVNDALETLGKEVFKPTVRYGRGLRHGLLLGAVIAMLYTPWPGKALREKLTAFGREAIDLVDAMRTGAADSR
ncbi:MAG: YtxH domain-containing protein [Candidatus Dormibacteria bacterium]